MNKPRAFWIERGHVVIAEGVLFTAGAAALMSDDDRMYGFTSMEAVAEKFPGEIVFDLSDVR